MWYNRYRKKEKREANTMYRLDRMRKEYEQFTAAEGYIIGFPVKGNVYAVEFTKIPRRYTRVQRECSACGGGYGLYVYIGAKDAKKLMSKAVLMGTVEDLASDKYNKGVMFEKMVYEHNGMEYRGKDNVPFHKSGDITIDGKEIQVKYAHARICYDKTLKKLKAQA